MNPLPVPYTTALFEEVSKMGTPNYEAFIKQGRTEISLPHSPHVKIKTFQDILKFYKALLS